MKKNSRTDHCARARRWTAIGLMAAFTICGCGTTRRPFPYGLYYSKDGEFCVIPPNLPKITVVDKISPERDFVDFASSTAPRLRYGLYSVEWYKQQQPFESVQEFYSASKGFVPVYVGTNFRGNGLFALRQTKELTVNGRPAFSFFATGVLDKTRAMWAGVSICFNDRIALAYVVYDFTRINRERLEEKLLAFAGSVRRLAPYATNRMIQHQAPY